MRIAPALAAASLFLLHVADVRGASPAAGGDRSVASAAKTLETARSNLAKAVQRIEKDPPSTADLDAAHSAVGLLKEAIDAGAEHEPKDLDYAKAALAARKELRTHRDYVDQRRAKVHLHNHRRSIDAALSNLDDRARRVAAKDARPKDFDEARAATAAVRKAADDARAFAKQDEKFAAYLTEVDATVARHEKAIDDRVTQLSVAKQRALVEESRRALSASLASLNKNATDAQFEGAERAASDLSKRLDEGKVLEAKDATYRADGDRARTDLAQARKRLDELWSEVGVSRLKAEIEPARKDLAEVAKALRKSPTEDQLAEARTASIVVRKLVEKYQPQASRIPAFGQYVNEVKKTLVEVEVELQRRALESARTAATQALRQVEKRSATEEHFGELNTALTILEKTLEETTSREAALVKPLGDGRTLLREARATVAKRRGEIEAEAQLRNLDSARKEATRALRQIEKRSVTEENFGELNTALTILEKTLEGTKSRDAMLVKPVGDARTLLREARATITKRRSEIEAELQLRNLDSARKEATRTLRQIEKRSATDENFGELNTALTILEKTLEATKSRDASLAKPIGDARTLLRDARTTAAKRRIEIDVQRHRAKVEEARGSASTAVGEAQQANAGRDRLPEAEAAVNQLRAVLDEGAALTKKDRDYATYDREMRKRIAELSEKIAKRKIALDAADGRALLKEHLATAKSELQAAKQPEVTDADVEKAAKSVDAVRQALEARELLETQDKGYAAQATEARKQLEGLKEELEFARQARTLRRRTLEALSAGASASAAASGKALRAQKDQYEKAIAQFKACEAAGTDLLEQNKALVNVAVLLEGRPSTPKDVIGECTRRVETTKQLLDHVIALIGFDEGPKRSFEKAKSLLSQGKKSEALEQFYECIATGRILQHGNPKLKDRKFEVAGASMTLAELVGQCTNHRNSLEAK